MRSIAKVISLIKIEWALDTKKPAILSSSILQMAVMALLSMLTTANQTGNQAKTWNSLFWITLIFCTLQAISKNFLTVSKNRWIYWNQMAAPAQILWSKIIYGWLTMIFLTLINFFFSAYPVLMTGYVSYHFFFPVIN